ncbi:1-deoxy-D-xylulose-5-phosphate synthase [Anaerovibrio sp.]|uniref:1-deoxy-D-xylulose-5-phosphate synthase n=1 Tax=Anaerovibrio sp. TaxID=1872532 RepID=UPI00260F77AD|nr:1-deoxy-D-xylulose-5-phosphate synthase [Anaerovibrio sp.]MDD6597973.1 1-deoxy-D-xylulose-5-phosphate synthase [Anaerovibrio sp.]MDD7677619.1 1-deoxy-D-xylulose-5-phosphate synthase [Anaerovibrio sp.]MDY2603395.1 1-deoxy-D-xylulose-5-phosphate synthase [Anaerovibrio sp.]MDY4883702.1 1-deoxy-D-xylulose-5-phosphate synthase [Anaerovibrio sp.]
MEQILDSIKHPADVQKLSIPHLHALAAELRRMIIDTCAKNGGHLAPSLGTVDLTLALYSVFNPERDKFVWDVGHQAYAHKILTGRRENFATLRTLNGITGFPKRSESRFDAFGTGHASTSISAALGMSIVRDLEGKDYNVVAIIGDGALTGGEAYEGLNYAGDLGKRLVVILNDNEMSIDRNVGAMSEYLSRIKLAPQYARAKKDIEGFIRNIPHIGDTVLKTAEYLKDGVKAAITPGGLFEEMGFSYIGPIDGHNIEAMQSVFRQIANIEGPVLVHVRTKKGRGYMPAEDEPDKFHGISKFNKATGEPIKNPSAPPSYTEIFSRTMLELGYDNHSMVAITAAMPSGTGLKAFARQFPERFFDVGIAEEHAVTMAAGMAAAGAHPVVALYSTFAQRAYDQIVHDVCLQKLPVTLCLDRAGLVGADGPTHHGVFDYSYLRHIPGMVVMAPKDENELRDMLYTAVKYEGPSAVRYPRGSATGAALSEGFRQLEIGKAELLSGDGRGVALLAVGSMVKQAAEAARLLNMANIKATVVNMRFIKPLDTAMLGWLLERQPELLVTLEENALAGGFGSAVLEFMADAEKRCRVLRFGIEDKFIEHGSCPQLLEKCGLTPQQIADRIIENIGSMKKYGNE